MSLIKCPDCGRDISDAAPSCVHCGRPKSASPPAPPPKKKSLKPPFWPAVRLIGILLLLGALALLVSGRAAALAAIGICLGLAMIMLAAAGPWFKPTKKPAPADSAGAKSDHRPKSAEK